MADLAEEREERFEMETCLGEGASGVVFRAFDNARGMTVAVKVLTRLDPGSLLRFKSEFRSLANITHPNLLQLYDLVARGHEWLLSMELIEGPDFLSYVRPPSAAEPSPRSAPPSVGNGSFDSFATVSILPGDKQGQTPGAPARSEKKQVDYGPLDEARLRSALLQLCDGLSALHREKRLHRDLKPANVLVSAAEERVVICDFGLVVEGLGISHGGATQPGNDNGQKLRGTISVHGSSHGEVAGTLAYMSPEQALGKPLDAASDWYAVGVMLYQALTTRVPFDTSLSFLEAVKVRNERMPELAHSLAPGAPRDLCNLAMDLLQTDPTARPSYEQIVQRLQGNRRTKAQHQAQEAGLIGRDEQLLQLHQAFSRARSGHAAIAMVSGRSGMGKSALMRKFLSEVGERDGAVVLSGRCYEREDLPYKAFDPLLDALSSFLMLLDQTTLESLLPDGMTSLVKLFPVLNRVPAIALKDLAGSRPADQLEQKRHAFAALRELLRRIALQQPLVLYIDDLQWGDLDSGPLFTELLRPPQAPAMLIVCAFRSEDEQQSALLRALFSTYLPEAGIAQPPRIELLPLGDAHTRELATTLLGALPGADAAAELITREAGGSPFFVGELASYMRQAGRLASSDIRLDTVIEARLSALPRDSRQLLSVIAVAGRPERRLILNAAAELGTRSFQALRVLESQSLVQSTGASAQDRIEAYHDRIRETAYRLLDAEVRRALHEKLAGALEARGEGDADALLDHFVRAGKAMRAGEYAVKAAEKAEQALAFQRAAQLYQRAIDLLEAQGEQRRALTERLGHALMLSGHGVAAADALFAALPGAPAEKAIELRSLGTIQLLRAGLVNRAFQELSRAEHILRMRTPLKPLQAVGMLLWRRLQIRLLGLRLRKPKSAISNEMVQRMDMLWGIGSSLSPIDQLRGNVYQAEHLLLAMKSGDVYRFARALAIETTVHSTKNAHPQRTQQVIEAALEMGGASREPHGMSVAKGTSGVSRMLEGRFCEAVRLTREAQDIVREHLHGTLAWDRVIMVLFELRAQAMLGNVRELAERVPEFLRDAERRGDLYAAVSVRTSHCCWAWLGLDRADEALQQVREADKSWVQEGYHLQHWYTTQAVGEVALYRDELSDAQLRLSREWKRAFLIRKKIQFTRAEMLYLRSRLCLAEARKSGSRAPLAQVKADIAALRKEKQLWIAVHARLLEACVLSFDQPAKAASLLHEVEGQFAAVDMKLMAAVSAYRRGQLIRDAAGERLVSDAEARMRKLGVASPAGFARMLAPGFPGL